MRGGHDPQVRVRISGISAVLPPRSRSSEEVESLIEAASPGFPIARGLVEMMTGIRERRIAEEGVHGSDLAAQAARETLEKTGTATSDVDLLIYASAGTDLLEPATANIVQEALGTDCPVFDVKNACNSFLNGIQVAQAFVESGAHKRILVTTGELGTRVIRFDNAELKDLRRNFAGYTLGDAGAAALVTGTREGRGILHREFVTRSRHWSAATIPGGGCRHPRGDEWTYIRGDGSKLKDAFLELGAGSITRALAATQTTWADYARILVHQVTVPFVEDFVAAAQVPMEKIEITVPHLGNMGAATLPVGFVQAEAAGRIKRGDLVMWIGLAGGISMGVMVAEA